MLAARNLASAEESARALGPRVSPLELDVGVAASRDRAAQGLGTTPVDILVNNAGVSLDGFDGEVARRTLEVNYYGAARVTDALCDVLAPNATVVMVSSGMGELGSVSAELRARLLDPGLTRPALEELVEQFIARATENPRRLGGWPASAYRVSKMALNALTRIWAREWATSGRRVNAVCPGWVRTDMGGSGASRSVGVGARGIVWAALDATGSGGFFRDGKPIPW